MIPSPRLADWLTLDRSVSSNLRVRVWEKPHAERAGGSAAHAAVELTLIERGHVRYTVGRQEHWVEAGDVMVVPRDADHTTTFETGMRGVALWLGDDLVARAADAMGPEVAQGALAPGVLARGRGGSERLRALLGALADEVADGEIGHARAAEAIGESVVIELLRRAPRAASEARDPRILRAIARMREEYSDPLGVDDLARTAGMSRFHFSRLFRDEVGVAPYQYLLRVRVARATELLQGGHASVTEAALAAGFTDLGRFARTYKRHTGRLPTEVRRGARSA